MKTGIGLPVFPGVSIGPAGEQAKFNAAVETVRKPVCNSEL